MASSDAPASDEADAADMYFDEQAKVTKYAVRQLITAAVRAERDEVRRMREALRLAEPALDAAYTSCRDNLFLIPADHGETTYRPALDAVRTALEPAND